MGSIAEFAERVPIAEQFLKPSDFSEQFLIPPDFSKFPKELPPSCAWTDPCVLDPTPNDPLPLSIPVINLSDPDSLKLIKRACEEWGTFQIINHGIPIELFAEVESETRQLFAFPIEQKIRALRAPYGMTGYGQIRSAPYFSKTLWIESFAMIDSPLEHAQQIWPSDSPPHARAKFCAVMVEFQEYLKEIGGRVLGLMLSSLGLSSEELDWVKPKDGQEPYTVLQLNSYPVCPDPTHAIGLPAHTDSSLLSIVSQNNVLGLQAQYKGQWVPVNPIEGALVIQVGDLLEIFSNGRFKSVLHRAAVNNSSHRYSSAFFYGPPPSFTVGPSEKLITDDHPRLYRSIAWKDYLEIRNKNLDGALKTLRLDPVGSNK